MERLFQLSRHIVNNVPTDFKRFLYHKINWDYNLIAIVGARGVGKTTLMLQYIKENLPQDEQTLYIPLDHIYFLNHRLFDLGETFHKNGGKFLFLDEVHKYPTWATEVKNLIDYFPDLKIVLSGSSILEIFTASADLSRRIQIYRLPEMSFREYLNYSLRTNFNAISLEHLLNNSQDIENAVNKQIRPLAYFKKYLKNGCYPFFKDLALEDFYLRLQQIVRTVIESDIIHSQKILPENLPRLEQLLGIIASLAPFKPNISDLARKLGIHRNTLLNYLNLLQRAEIIKLLTFKAAGDAVLNKPEKIYLANTNLMYALVDSPNIGNIRETFFFNQLSYVSDIRYSGKGDFLVNDKYLFEIGGKAKTYKQIADIPNLFVAADDIEYRYKNKLPLWLFGFLY